VSWSVKLDARIDGHGGPLRQPRWDKGWLGKKKGYESESLVCEREQTKVGLRQEVRGIFWLASLEFQGEE